MPRPDSEVGTFCPTATGEPGIVGKVGEGVAGTGSELGLPGAAVPGLDLPDRGFAAAAIAACNLSLSSSDELELFFGNEAIDSLLAARAYR